MKIPSNKTWIQLNEGEITGVLHETKNVALDTIGQLKLARRPVAIMSSQQDLDFSDTIAITYFDSKYIAITDDELFAGDLLGNTWSQITGFSPNTTLDSDAIVFNNRLVVTTDANVDDWGGGVDDNTGLYSLTSGVPHPMAIFDSNPTYKLAIGNGSSLKLLDTSYAASPTVLTLASQFIITSIAYRNGYLYLGTKTNDGSEARIFIWNGSGTNAQYEVPVGTEWVYSIIPFGSTVAALTNAGQLLTISGAQANVIANLPVYQMPHARWQGATSSIPRVYHRGMVAVGQTIFINLDGKIEEGFIPEMKTGIWVYDPDAGLYHRATSSTDKLVSDNSLSVTDNIITTTLDHNLLNGDTVQFETLFGLSGLDIDYAYYVTVIDTNQIKLSLSREAQTSGQYVSITGTAVGSDELFYFPNTDGGSQDCRPGAIALTSINETGKLTLESEVLWGSRSRNQAGDTVYTLNSFHDSSHVGSFTTQRIYTENIEQTWKDLYPFIDGMTNEYDKVILKAQTKYQRQVILLDGVWAASNVINTGNTAQSTAWSDIEEGDELVIYDGYGQGKTVHVTNIEAGALTYSVTVDESIGTVNGVCIFYRTNFKKFGECTTTNFDNGFFKAPLLENMKSPWIKIKVELRGADMAINMLELSNVIHKNT